MDGYGNYMMHQQQVSTNFYNKNNNNQQPQRYQSANGSYGYPGANEWAGTPLIKSPSELQNHKKLYSSRSNGYEYDESSMSRLAKHTHGAPIIMSSRYRSKSMKPMQPFGHENGNLRNYSNNANGFAKAPSSDDAHTYDDFGYHANGTCLPRIIKPRKRRKKDRKPIANASMENNPPNPFTFISNQSNSFMQSMNGNGFHNTMNENFKRPAPPSENSLFFNCDFDPSTVLPLPSSISSSPISLSNSSLSSSTTTSSCSCRLCDPNCKIWAFPLRRSFSDNSAVELDHHNNNASSSSDSAHIETNKKDVGVIGGNRVKTEWNSTEATLSILDMIEFNHYQNHQQKTLIADVNRLRSESLSDSGDSGCDLLLGGLNISDDILCSTFKADSLTSDGINRITQQLSEFNLMATRTSDVAATQDLIFNDTDLSNLDANECGEHRVHINDLSRNFRFNTITKSLSSCEFGDHHQRSNLDNFLAMDIASSGSTCNYGNLMSPMLVNKQNYSNSIDLNNNHHDGPAPAVDGAIDNLKEQTLLFDCFDVTWNGS